jgi:pyrimidine deaminase RibD-like protein
VADVDDLRWLRLACDLARRCPPSRTAFSVGAVIVGTDGREISRGFSRESDPHDHAEESALAKAGPGSVLAGATVYSSLEPCGERGSRPLTCTDLIIDAGLARVVFAWREPTLFVQGTGAERLRAHGIEIVELPELAGAAREPNAHLLDR